MAKLEYRMALTINYKLVIIQNFINILLIRLKILFIHYIIVAPCF